MGTTTLKLEGTNGDLKEITTSEENYLAYQAGLHLSALDSSDVASITEVSTNNTIIGAFTDTRYDDASGTHGFTDGNAPVQQTITSLYQREGVTDFAGDSAAYRYPLEFTDNSGTPELHELDSAEVDTISDRLLSRIAVSEYPGVYKLATSAPTGYTTYKSNVFSDNLQTGVSGTTYNIYVKNTMSAPTAVRPVAIKRSSGLTGTFQGVQEMTDAEIRYSFGSRVQSRISNSSAGIGTYQMRSSAQGAPSDTGTWSNRGTASDTRYNTVNTDYAAAYTRTRSSNYVGNYSRNFARTFAGTFTGNFVLSFIGNYTGNYSRNFGGDYTGNYARTFVGDYIGNYARNFAGNYIGNYSRNFSAVYSRTRVTDYVGDFTGNFTGNYSRNFQADYQRTRATTYTGNYAGNYLGNYVGNYARAFSADYTTNFTQTFTGNFLGEYTGNYARAYSADYQRTRSSAYSLAYNRTRSSTYSAVYQRTRTSSYAADYLRTSTTDSTRASTGVSTVTRSSAYTSTSTQDFAGNYTGNYVGTTIDTNSSTIETYTLYHRTA